MDKEALDQHEDEVLNGADGKENKEDSAEGVSRRRFMQSAAVVGAGAVLVHSAGARSAHAEADGPGGPSGDRASSVVRTA